jgi:hypothetical protein
MEFSARTWYDTDTGSEITSYIFDLSTKKIKNQKTKEIMTIPADEIAENPYEQ